MINRRSSREEKAASVSPTAAPLLGATMERKEGKPVRRVVAALRDPKLSVLAVLVLTVLILMNRKSPAGPPRGFVVRGSRSQYTKVPDECRKRFYIEDGNKFRRTMIRAFRSRGWIKSNDSKHAQFIWDKGASSEQFDKLLAWHRYNQLPGFRAWDTKDGFIVGFEKYREKNPNADLSMIPESYLLTTKKGRAEFSKRLFQGGGLQVPWVLKMHNVNNGLGIQMLGPNSEELKSVLEKVGESDEDYIIQNFICNELTWWGGRKFDLRFYWMVASVDPLIVLYHDGYARVGNSVYQESDFSSTKQHLTTHTFLANEEKGTADELRELIQYHYKQNYWDLRKRIKIDPFEHVRNQFKQSIALTADAFRDVTFGNDKRKYRAENSWAFYGVDFVIDNDLDVWYIEAQAGPGLEEEFDFRVELHRDLLRSAIDIVEEIQLKQEADAEANLLPLQSLGGWEIVYAGNGDDNWMYHYDGYSRPEEKVGCDLSARPPKTQKVRPRSRKTGKKRDKSSVNQVSP
jgi:hypothetical protein